MGKQPNLKQKQKKQKHTVTETVLATAKGVAEGLCPTCGTKTEPSKVDAIVHYVEMVNKHPFPYQDVRYCRKCRKMLYIEKPKDEQPGDVN